MNDKILKAIEESLPQMQVKAIHEALGELEQLRSAHTEDIKTIKELQTEIRDLHAQRDNLQVELRTATELRDKVTESNVQLMARDVENRVAVLQAELHGVNTTIDRFLKNTIYRETLQHQIADEYTSVQMQYINGQQVPVPTPGKNYRQVADTKTSEQE